MTHRDPLAPYARLLDLARREAELVAGGRYDELAAVADQRAELAATLPPTAPAAARPLLEEALRLVQGSAATLSAGVADLRGQLGQLGTGRRAVAGYGGGPTAGPRLLDRRG